MLSRFHLIPERYGRTDRRTDVLYQYRASVCWRAIINVAKTCVEETNAIHVRRIGEWRKWWRMPSSISGSAVIVDSESGQWTEWSQLWCLTMHPDAAAGCPPPQCWTDAVSERDNRDCAARPDEPGSGVSGRSEVWARRQSRPSPRGTNRRSLVVVVVVVALIWETSPKQRHPTAR